MFSMQIKCFLIGTLVLSAAVQAGVYKWVDEEGQVHFGQFPPQGGEEQAQKIDVEQKGNPLLTIDGDRIYCVSMEIGRRDQDPMLTLANVRGNLPHRRRQLAEIRRYYNRIVAQRTSAGLSVRTLEDMDRLECAVQWGEQQERELEDARQRFVAEAERVRAEYEAILAECGEDPLDQGWTNSPQAKEWVECRRRTIDSRNAKLKELKRYESYLDLIQ